MSTNRPPRRLQISLRADGLKNVASSVLKPGKKSSPYAILKVTGGPYDGRCLGRTETVRNNQSPDWCTIFIVDFWSPGTYVPITVSLFDDNSKKPKQSSTDPHLLAAAAAAAMQQPSTQSGGDRPGKSDCGMGEATFELYDVISSPGNERSVQIQSFGGKLYLHAVDSLSSARQSGSHLSSVSSSFASSHSSAHSYGSSNVSSLPSIGSKIKLHLRGLDIQNVEAGMLGLNRTDPYFELSKKHIDHSSGVTRWKPIYRSIYIKNNLNPFWETFYMDLEILCNCDLDWPLRIAVFDYDKNTRNKEVGSVEVTTSALIRHKSFGGNNADRENAFQLQNGAGRICILAADIIDAKG